MARWTQHTQKKGGLPYLHVIWMALFHCAQRWLKKIAFSIYREVQRLNSKWEEFHSTSLLIGWRFIVPLVHVRIFSAFSMQNNAVAFFGALRVFISRSRFMLLVEKRNANGHRHRHGHLTIAQMNTAYAIKYKYFFSVSRIIVTYRPVISANFIVHFWWAV